MGLVLLGMAFFALAALGILILYLGRKNGRKPEGGKPQSPMPDFGAPGSATVIKKNSTPPEQLSDQ